MQKKQAKKPLITAIDQYSHAIDEGLHHISGSVADILAEEEASKPNQLISKQVHKERLQRKLDDEFSTLKKRLESGSSHIMNKMIAFSKDDKEMFSEEVVNDLTKLMTLATTMSTHQAEFIEQLSQEKSLIDIAHVSHSTFEKMYQAAKALYTEKQFSEAADAFGFLTILDSQNYSCWLGLAHAEFFAHNWEQALFSYAFCCHLNPQDPTCHIYSSRCYEEVHELDNAINAIDLALFVVEQQPKHKELLPQLERERQRLAGKQKNG